MSYKGCYLQWGSEDPRLGSSGPGVPRSPFQPWELAAFLLGALQWAACPGLPFSVLLLPRALPGARSPLQGVQNGSWSLHRRAMVVCCLWFVFSTSRALVTQSVLTSLIITNAEAFSYNFSPGAMWCKEFGILCKSQMLCEGAQTAGASLHLGQNLCVWRTGCHILSCKKPSLSMFMWSIICNRINSLACHVLHSRSASDFPALGICNSLERIADVCPNANIFSALWTLISQLKL